MVADRPPRDGAVAPVRPGEELDWASVGRWLRGAVPELRGPLRVLQFPHGRANLTYLLEVGGVRVVLRRPPFGPLPPGGHDMRREYRVLSRLWRVYDRAPRAYAFTDDPSVAGADCFVMEYRRGEVIRDRLPASMRGHVDARSVEPSRGDDARSVEPSRGDDARSVAPSRGDELGRRLMFALVDAMAELHLVDPADCDLADLGKPEGFVARQVSGWARRWELAAPSGADPLMAEVGQRLAATLPSTQRHGIVHNDLKLDNCQFDPADPDRVTSVFDWDMATLGDPLVDLGTLLGYIPEAGDPDQAQGAVRYPPELELPSRADIVARYAERTSADVSGITWYLAFARWKTATVYQQLANRALRGRSGDARNAALGETVTALAESAHTLLKEA